MPVAGAASAIIAAAKIIRFIASPRPQSSRHARSLRGAVRQDNLQVLEASGRRRHG
jgi:hypothetical protein